MSCIRLIDHQPVDEPRIVCGDACRRGFNAKLLHDLRRGAFDRAARNQRRDSDDRHLRRSQGGAKPGNGEDRIDAEVGIRGTQDHRLQRLRVQHVQELLRRPRLGGTGEAQRAHRRRAAQTNEIMLELEFPGIGVEQRRQRRITHRQQPAAHAETLRELRRDCGQSLAGREAPRALDVQHEITVPEQEPVGTALTTQLVHETKCLLGAAPALPRVHDPAECVQQRVEIRADAQTEVRKVIAGVDEHRKFTGRQHTLEPERELGATDATRDRQHCACGSQRNRSSDTARTRL